MSKIFYISDLHFGHANILKYDDRPWFNVADMDKAMIENWNSVVTNEDTVYILGDIAWYDTDKIIAIFDQLNGQKVLVKGNHDRCHDNRLRAKFLKITDYLEIKDSDRNVILCHYPIPCFKNHFYGWYHLYGHVHNSFEARMMEHCEREMTDLYVKQCRMCNVGAMMPWMNYTPRTLDEIIAAKGWK